MPALSTTQDTTVENIYHELADIFDLSQNGPASHAKLVKKCQNLYKRVIDLIIYQIYFIRIYHIDYLTKF